MGINKRRVTSKKEVLLSTNKVIKERHTSLMKTDRDSY